MAECVQPLTDPGIATLSEVLDPNALAKHLRASPLSPGNGRVIEQIQVRVLQRKVGRRCTLEIGLRTENGWHSVNGSTCSGGMPRHAGMPC